MECPHSDYLDAATCSICKHGIPGPKPVREEDWWLRLGASSLTVDPGDLLVEGILSGETCRFCGTSRVPLGCSCSRLTVGRQDWEEAAEWLENAPHLATEMGIKFTEDEAAHVASSVQKRILRRMDLTDEEREDEVFGMKEQFGIEPKWFPVRRTEPTHLPI